MVAVQAAARQASAAAGICAVLAAMVERGLPVTATLCLEVVKAADRCAIARAALEQVVGSAAFDVMEDAALQLVEKQLLPSAAVPMPFQQGRPSAWVASESLLPGLASLEGTTAAAAAEEREAEAAALEELQAQEQPVLPAADHQRLARELGRKKRKKRRRGPGSRELLAHSTDADREAIMLAMNDSEVSAKVNSLVEGTLFG
jgi:hypothetical protein